MLFLFQSLSLTQSTEGQTVLFQKSVRHPRLGCQVRIRIQFERFTFTGQILEFATFHRLFNLFVDIDRHLRPPHGYGTTARAYYLATAERSLSATFNLPMRLRH